MTLLYPRRRYYPAWNPYGYRQPLDKRFFAADGDAQDSVQKDKVIKAIAKIIVINRAELSDKLVQLGLVCSCTVNEMKEKDLADAIVENANNKSLQLWLAGKIMIQPSMAGIVKSNVINEMVSDKAKKDEYKKAIAGEAINYKEQGTGVSVKSKISSGAPIAIGVTLLLVGAFAISRT